MNEKQIILKYLKDGKGLFDSFDNVKNLLLEYLTELKNTIIEKEPGQYSQFVAEIEGMDYFHGREAGSEFHSNPGFLDTLGRIIHVIGGGFLLSADISMAITLAPLSGPAALGTVATIGAGAGLIGHACRVSG